MSTILDIMALNKSYGGIKATDDLNLSLDKGELHAIIGPNGAGKTTLVSQLSGFVEPTSGTVTFKGQDITRLAPHTRAHMGIARTYQITSLVMDMSVTENVMLAVQAAQKSGFRFIAPVGKKRKLVQDAEALLNKVGLLEFAGMRTGALSHGQHRRLEIAMALAANADLLLLDEPMAGLGPEETGEMIDLLKDLKGNTTILLIEHDMDAVFALADRISVLVYGHIIATGTPDDIRQNTAVQEAYLGDEA